MFMNLVDVVAAQPGEDAAAGLLLVEEPVLWVADCDLCGDHAHFDRNEVADQPLLDDAAGVADRVEGAVLVEDSELTLQSTGGGCDLLAFDGCLADRLVCDQVLAGFEGADEDWRTQVVAQRGDDKEDPVLVEHRIEIGRRCGYLFTVRAEGFP